MKNTQNKKGFTLVELIIVITILAVLATIAFVSFQGYAADSRDSKVKSEVGQLRNSIEAKSAEGVSVLSMVANTGSNLSTISIGGAAPTASEYKAGNVNFTVLGADANKFGNYRVGASTKNGGVYQLAGKLEKTTSAFVVGNYSPRTASGVTGTGSDTAKTLTLANTSTGAGFFKVGDTTTFGKVTKVSTDLLTITFDGTVTLGATSTNLSAAESVGLIAATAGTNVGSGVVDGSTSALPY